MAKYLAILITTILLGCQTLKPTPLLYNDLSESYLLLQEEFKKCSNELTIELTKPGCRQDKLTEQSKITQSLAKVVIARDIKQSKPYIIYLETATILVNVDFSIRSLYYVEAQPLALQFLELQKVGEGEEINLSRYYFVFFVAAAGTMDSLDNTEILYIVEGETRIGTLEKAIHEGSLIVSLPGMRMREVPVMLYLIGSVRKELQDESH